MFRLPLAVLVMLAFVVHAAQGADPKSDPQPNSPKGDLSAFPIIKGKVTHALGTSFGYLHPQVGAEMELDLKTVSKLQKLTFKPLPGDPVEEYYIPLAIDDNGVCPLVVETYKTYTNGAFDCMRLVSRSKTRISPHVKVDVIGAGPEVSIWVTVEQEVVLGVFVIEGKADGPFPKITPPKAE